MLIINIGPCFLQVISCNKFTGRKFNYFFDSGIFSYPVNSKFDLSTVNFSNDQLQNIYLNDEQQFFVKVNLYTEKSICDKYLLSCYVLYDKQPNQLRKKLLEIFSSKYCKSWNENWIRIVLVQLITFMSCIKNGVFYARLFETACEFSRKLLKELHTFNYLLEYKYSYLHFHNIFMEGMEKQFVEVLNKVTEIQDLVELNRSGYSFCSRQGFHLEECIVDGFSILSFETEKELKEYECYDRTICINNYGTYNANINNKKFPNNKRRTKREKIQGGSSIEDDKLKNINIMAPAVQPSSELKEDQNSNFIVFENKELLQIKSSHLLDCSESSHCYLKQSENVVNNKTMREFIGRNSFDKSEFSKDSSTDYGLQQINHGMAMEPERISTNQAFHSCKNTFCDEECRCKKLSLSRMLGQGRVRTLYKEGIVNFEHLQNVDGTISSQWSSVSTSALENSCKIQQRIVDLMIDKSFVEVDKYSKLQKGDKTCIIETELKETEIETEVKGVVEDLIINVCKMNMLKEKLGLEKNLINAVNFQTDSKKGARISRELRKISATIFNENALTGLIRNQKFCDEEMTNYDYKNQCGLLKVSTNCGKIKCIFECTCSDIGENENNSLKGYKMDNTNGVIIDDRGSEKKETRTVIGMLDGKNINITSLADKSRRPLRISTRLRNSVLLDETSLPLSITSYPSRFPVERKKLETGTVKKMIDGEQLKNGRKLMQNRRLECSVGICNGEISLADLFIWCTIHNKYNCLCPAPICRMNENILMWKPSKSIKYLTNKVLSKVVNVEQNCEVYYYDSQEYSARTFGIPINYNLRNRTDVFLTKMKYDLDHHVLSSTNSYIKMKYLIFKPLEEVNESEFNHNIGNKQIFRSTFMENVHLTHDSMEVNLVEINVLDCSYPSSESDEVITISDSDCDGEETCEINQGGHGKISNIEENSNKHVSINPIGTDDNLSRHKQIQDITRSLCLEHNYVKTYESKVNHKLRNLDKDDPFILPRNETFNGVCTSCIDPKEEDESKSKQLQNKNEEINVGQSKVQEESIQGAQPINFTVQPIKVTYLRPKNLSQLIYKPSNTLYPHQQAHFVHDPELENCVLRMQDYHLNGNDEKPKFGLFCTTLGIGHLPVFEYNESALIVQDPVFSELLHSFKNLNSANIWLNKFLKDFLANDLVDTALNWVIVKPGILKLFQSQPFSPAILENSSLATYKNVEIQFNKMKQYFVKNIPLQIKRTEFAANKRKCFEFRIEGEPERKKIKQVEESKEMIPIRYSLPDGCVATETNVCLTRFNIQ